MGSSYIEYKGYGFWSRDNFTESWLLALIAEMRKEPVLEQWQQALIDHWLIQSEIDAGCMSLQLDEYLEDTPKQQLVLALSRKALQNADRFGAHTGDLFIKLLEGQLRSIVSSSLDYMTLSDEGSDP